MIDEKDLYKKTLDNTGKVHFSAVTQDDMLDFICTELQGKSIDGSSVSFRPVSPAAITNRPLGLHSELSYMPEFMPRYLCLYCNSSAHLGGQTLLAESDKVWEKVKKTEAYKKHIKKFEPRSRPYRLARNFPKEVLISLLGVTTEEQALAKSTDNIKIHPSLDCNYFTVRSSLSLWSKDRDGNAHFSNCFHAAFYSPQGYGLDSDFLETEEEEITDAMYLAAQAIEWKANEAIIIDNFRWMHGRLPYFDKQRSMAVAFIY